MSGARLASSVFVTALLRRAESEGGFAAVLAKGDAQSGSILVILTEKGANPRLFERILQPDGRYLWQANDGQATDKERYFDELIARRRRIDPDLWLIELDVASGERFAAEMNQID